MRNPHNPLIRLQQLFICSFSVLSMLLYLEVTFDYGNLRENAFVKKRLRLY